MVDVVICYAGADSATADRLAQAVARNGYTLWSEDALSHGASNSANIADRISGAKAAVVIWSQAAAASEWVKAEANFARGQHKLIQASADGRPPPLPFSGDVAPLSDWRGEEGHPGWRAIRGRLETLCAARPAAPPAPPGSAPRSAPPPTSAESPRKGRGGLVALLAVALLALAAAGSFLWMRSQGPIAVQQRTAARTPPSSASSRPPAQAAAEVPAAEGLAPQPVEAEPAPIVAATPGEADPAPRRAGPRINRRNSENMRRFCERAGRGTPQCRNFERLLRNQRR